MTDEPAHPAPPLLRDPNASTGPLFEFNRPTVIVLFYLATWFTGFSAVVGVVLAYAWRDEAQGWEASHMTWLVRTFWLALASVIAVIVFTFVALAGWYRLSGSEGEPAGAILIGLLLAFACMVWLLLRCVVALVKAQQHKPMPRPRSWLV